MANKSTKQPDSKPNLYTQSRAFDRISFYFPISRLQVCEKDGYSMSWAVKLVQHIYKSLSSAPEKFVFIQKLESKFTEITRELLDSFLTGDFGYFCWKWILDRNLLNSEVHVEKNMNRQHVLHHCCNLQYFESDWCQKLKHSKM